MSEAAPPAETAPTIRNVALTRPLTWLARGARDMAHNPAASLFYGMCVAAAGVAILLVVGQLPYLFTAAISGFLLVAPMIATGLYDLSRRRERGEPVRLADSMLAWRRNRPGLIGFALFALLAGTAWQVVSVVIVALLYKGGAAEPAQLAMDVLRDPRYMTLFMAYVGVGGLLASLVFALSVVSVPMLLDRDRDLLQAMRASLGAVAANPLPLAFWAAIIMVFCIIGFATGLLGFVVIMPLLGHASWHAYRDLVAD